MDEPLAKAPGKCQLPVIASEAKQSSLARTVESWIAAPLRGSQ
jgi:hypothetical protein